MRPPARLAFASACLLTAAALISACGGDSGPTGSAGGSAQPAPSRPAPAKSKFPKPFGRNLEELVKMADAHSELLVSPAAQVFYRGENRFPFGVSERHGGPVSDAEVALYYARVPAPEAGRKAKPGNKGLVGKAQAQALEEPAVGPFPARIESLAAKPAFSSETTAADPDAAEVVYSAQIDFPENGEWRLAALIREGDELTATLLPSAHVGEFKSVPKAGDPAPRIHTPTAEEVGGDVSKITTRRPPDTQNKVDYADALGKEPILLLFATPQFCQSRVCGPVVDVAEQAQREYGDKAAFIHMEIFNDNDPGKGVRPQVRQFHLPSEPWLFAINRDGVVSSAVEGAFGLDLMHEVADEVIGE
ncbi:MAG: hypothetical protein ACOYD4_13615 [Solirubrobacterales bacterium]